MDRKVEKWTNDKAAQMSGKGASGEEIGEFLQDVQDFLMPLRNVKKIRFHNYNSSWFLDVSVSDNYAMTVTKENVEMLQNLYGCHEFDSLLEELDTAGVPDESRPSFYYFVIDEVLDTDIAV